MKQLNSIFFIVWVTLMSVAFLTKSNTLLAQSREEPTKQEESEKSEEQTEEKKTTPQKEEVKTQANSQPDGRGYIVKVGEEAAAFEITLDDGTVLKQEDMKGKVIMLQFTASWCGVCRKEMPLIENEIWEKHKDNENFILIGVDRDEPLETVLKFKDQTGVTYPMGLDPGAEIFQLFATKKSGVTRNVIIDQDGKIVMLTRLFERTEFDEMKEVIDGLLE